MSQPDDSAARGCLTIIFVALFALLMGGCGVFRGCTNERVHVGTVQQTYVRHQSDDFQIVLDKDDGTTEVFDNEDSLLNWKWNSADINADLKPGDRVSVRTVGYRWHWRSWFPNVIEVKKVGPRK